MRTLRRLTTALAAFLALGCSNTGSTHSGAAGTSNGGGGGRPGTGGMDGSAATAGSGGAKPFEPWDAHGCATVAPRSDPITVDQFIGVNGFVDDPIGTLSVAGIVREYHDWAWDESDDASLAYPSDVNYFAPNFGGWWNFDDYYASYASAASAVIPSPVVQNGMAWLNANRAAQPVPSGASTTEPASYTAHADHLFQYVARYGATPVADAMLKLAQGQPRRSGLTLVRYLEDWNEPDRSWLGAPGSPGNFSADELGAMLSADYDGHCGALGAHAGVRRADPTVHFVMAGLAGGELGYLDGVADWADAHRSGSFPADVVNLHHYCRDPAETGVLQRTAGGGVSPEDGGLQSWLEARVAWRDRRAPGREIWLSEFGYDVNPDSPQRAPAIGAMSGLETQGAWIVRSLLAALAARVDRAFVYMIRDVNAASTTQFDSSGLVYYGDSLPTGKKAHDPKPSFYYVATMKQRLSGMVFASSVDSGDARVSIAEFRSSGGGGAYAVWAPTSDGTAVPGFSLAVPGAARATEVRLSDGAMTGVERALPLDAGRVSIDVGETPRFVIVDAVP